MASVEDLIKESFGSDCTIEKSSQFLSVYRENVKMAVINVITHRMILYSGNFLDGAAKFSEGYTKIVQGVGKFQVLSNYD
ncbi:hypothetical protein HYT23_02525 [Candidatus Pacearchaeota archaeon]|nr:hypothetical protein [Candidatus Pacearchaeota archaeon]